MANHRCSAGLICSPVLCSRGKSQFQPRMNLGIQVKMFGCCYELGVLSDSICIAPIFAEVFTFELLLRDPHVFQ